MKIKKFARTRAHPSTEEAFYEINVRKMAFEVAFSIGKSLILVFYSYSIQLP